MRHAINHLFLFIGADPNTDWLTGSDVALDAKGFIVTGAQAGGGRHALETARRGVFAIGDVRATSVKRVAAFQPQLRPWSSASGPYSLD